MNVIEPYITKILKRNICHVISFGENDVNFIQHKHKYYPAKEYNTHMDNIKIETINSARTRGVITSTEKEDYERYLGDFPFRAGEKNILFTHDTSLNEMDLKDDFDLIIVKNASGIDIKHGVLEHGPTKIKGDITYYVFDGKFYVFLKDGSTDELENIFKSTLKRPYICIGAIDWLGDPLADEGRLAAVKQRVKQGAAWAQNKIYPPKQNAADDKEPVEDVSDTSDDDSVPAIPVGSPTPLIVKRADLENAENYSSYRYRPFIIE